MSNPETGAFDEEKIPFNGKQCAIALTVATLLASACAASWYKSKHESDGGGNPGSKLTTPEQDELSVMLTYNEGTCQGLPIRHSRDRKEIDTWKESRQDGYYVFQEGSNITYWKIQGGRIIKSEETMTLTW